MTTIASPEFRQRVAKAIRSAVLRYEKMAGMGPWNTPELWLQSALAAAFEEEFYVMLEVRTRDLLAWHETGRRVTPGREQPLARNGRIDVVLFDRTAANPSGAETVALIECRRYGQKFDCNDDAERLRGIAKEIALPSGAIMVAYLQELSEAAIRSRIRSLLAEVDAASGSTAEECWRSSAGHDHCATVVADLAPRYDAAELAELELLRDAVRAGLASGIAEDFSFSKLKEELNREAARRRSGSEAV